MAEAESGREEPADPLSAAARERAPSLERVPAPKPLATRAAPSGKPPPEKSGIPLAPGSQLFMPAGVPAPEFGDGEIGFRYAEIWRLRV